MFFSQTNSEEIISTGIDIGTSTTKIVISQFSLMNTAGGTRMPRIEIVDKKIIHRSDIYRTPLLSPTAIDMQKVERIIQSEYEKAGIQPSEVKTGAIIITGETATKSNAEEVIHHLSEFAGDFLVATAGPDLESIIAAKGSGAFEYSKKTSKTIANIDIGGGTTNVAVYRNGQLCGTCTLHIGGRLITYANDVIQTISPPIQKLIERKNFRLSVGDRYDESRLKEITDFMAATIGRMLNRQLTDEDHDLLLGHFPNWDVNVDAIMFSGGVGECIYRLENADFTKFQDIGLLLAQSLQENEMLKTFEWVVPNETSRATVLGAGMQLTEISGSTIQVEDSQLPLKNLPVYEISFEHDFERGIRKIVSGIQEAVNIFDPGREGLNFALYLSELPYMRFKDIQKLADALRDGLKAKPNPNQPLVIVVQSDHAKVLGQTLITSDPNLRVICIDQIQVENGDYLDIGKKLQTEVVPVIVKTLAFHK